MLFDTARTDIIDLGGASSSQSVYTAVNALTVALVRVIYEEATSADAGVAIRVGKIGSASFFSTFTSEINKSIGNVTTLTLTNTTLAAGETMIVECDGNKAGTGAVTVQIELESLI